MKRVLVDTARVIKELPIEASALINPKYCNSTGIRVYVRQGGEGPSPHVHVLWNGSECETFISLTDASYSTHHSVVTKMPKDIKQAFVEMMSNVWVNRYIKDKSGVHEATGYEAAVETWCDTYEDGDYSKFKFDDTGKLIMPDYTQLS